MKTGYCHNYNHKAPLDSITDRLHIGNRWLGLSGLAMYDNTARVHDPIVPHMLTCDSRAVDYPRHSPFSHCAGNPANILDLDGNEIKLYGTAMHKIKHWLCYQAVWVIITACLWMIRII